MSEHKVFEEIEDAPHIELNNDGSTIDLSNWHEPANRNWSYRNTTKVLPYVQKIPRGPNAVHELSERPVDISPVAVVFRNRKMELSEYLKESHCDGLIVLHGDDIVYENYRRMDQDDRHLCQSVSKTTVSALLGSAVGSGLLDPQKTVDEYFPDVAGGYKGVTIQDVLDMNVALKFSEDFTDPSAEIHDYEMITGWHPDRGGQAEGVLEYIRNIAHDSVLKLDGTTNYLCPNTDLLVCLMERVTGKSFVELFKDLIYQHIGAESDAYFLTDVLGTAVGSGGMIIRLRDLARYGQIYANLGVANDGTQVIPVKWIRDCLDISKGTNYYLGRDFKYHNQMTSNGKAFCHLGVGGQMLYASTETKVVVAQFSTTSAPSNGDLDFGNALYNFAEAINEFLV